MTKIFLFVALTGLFFASCSKENSQSSTPEEQMEASRVSSEADGEAEEVFNHLFDDVMGANDDVGVAGTGVFFGRSDTLTPVPRCFTVTVAHPNNTPFPVVITVNFGNTGCMGPDGRVRRGKIITTYTNRLIFPGAQATTTFDGYYINNVQVEGVHKITNISNPNTTPMARAFRVEVINGKLTKPNGNFTMWNSTKTITQIEGAFTPNIPLDDIYKIEGSSRGQVRRGSLVVAWESTIIDPLIKRFTCRWLVKGKIRTVRLSTSANSPWVAVLDFGNGQCDNQAVITINGQSHQITLP